MRLDLWMIIVICQAVWYKDENTINMILKVEMGRLATDMKWESVEVI